MITINIRREQKAKQLKKKNITETLLRFTALQIILAYGHHLSLNSIFISADNLSDIN